MLDMLPTIFDIIVISWVNKGHLYTPYQFRGHTCIPKCWISTKPQVC